MYEAGKWEPVTRWDPFKELEEMSTRLNRYFGKRGNGDESLTVTQWAPAVDVSETEKEFQIRAELPDIKKEDVKVTVEEGILTIQGERKAEKEEKGKKFHRIERSYGSFLRSFSLPDDADATKIAAEFKDGMLNIRLPKAEKPKPKTTEVKIA